MKIRRKDPPCRLQSTSHVNLDKSTQILRQTKQIWQWVKQRNKERPDKRRELTLRNLKQSGELL